MHRPDNKSLETCKTSQWNNSYSIWGSVEDFLENSSSSSSTTSNPLPATSTTTSTTTSSSSTPSTTPPSPSITSSITTSSDTDANEEVKHSSKKSGGGGGRRSHSKKKSRKPTPRTEETTQIIQEKTVNTAKLQKISTLKRLNLNVPGLLDDVTTQPHSCPKGSMSARNHPSQDDRIDPKSWGDEKPSKDVDRPSTSRVNLPRRGRPKSTKIPRNELERFRDRAPRPSSMITNSSPGIDDQPDEMRGVGASLFGGSSSSKERSSHKFLHLFSSSTRRSSRSRSPKRKNNKRITASAPQVATIGRLSGNKHTMNHSAPGQTPTQSPIQHKAPLTDRPSTHTPLRATRVRGNSFCIDTHEAMKFSKDDGPLSPLSPEMSDALREGFSKRGADGNPDDYDDEPNPADLFQFVHEWISTASKKQSTSQTGSSSSPLNNTPLKKLSKKEGTSSSDDDRHPLSPPQKRHRRKKRRSRGNRTLGSRRDAEFLQDAKQTKYRQEWKVLRAIEAFNENPQKGFSAMLSVGLVKSDAQDVASFLHECKYIEKRAIGEFISEDKTLNRQVLESFVAMMNFDTVDFDLALRRFLYAFRLPGEGQRIDRLMKMFAQQYYKQNIGTVFADTKAVHSLAFALIMLNTDAHSDNVRHKMTFPQFVRNVEGHNGGHDFPEVFLDTVYRKIVQEEIKMDKESDRFPNAIRKGWLNLRRKGDWRWAKRWVVLSDSCIYAFKKPTDVEPLFTLPLRDILATPLSKAEARGKKSCFLIRPLPYRGITQNKASINAASLFVAAPSDVEISQWLLAIEKHCEQTESSSSASSSTQQSGSSVSRLLDEHAIPKSSSSYL